MTTVLAADFDFCDLAGNEELHVVKTYCEQALQSPEVNQNSSKAGVVYIQLIKIANQQKFHDQAENLLFTLKTQHPEYLQIDENNYDWFYEMGRTKIRKSEYKNAILNFQEALTIAKSINDPKRIAYSLNALGLSYKENDQYQKGLKAYHESLKYKKQFGLPLSIGNTLMNIADVYDLLKEYNNALNYYNKAKEQYLLSVNDDSVWRENLAHCYESIGIVYNKLEQYESSIEALDQSLKLLKELGLEHNKTILYTYMAKSHQGQSDLYQADMYYQKALDEDNKGANNNALLRYERAKFFMQEHDFDQAIRFVDKGIEYSKNNRLYGHILPDLHHLKSLILQQQGSLDSAIISMNTYYELKEKFLTKKYNQNTQNILHQIEIGQNEYELSLLEKDNQLKAIRINRQYWVIFSLLLVALLSGIYAKNKYKRRTREKNELLDEIQLHRDKLSQFEKSSKDHLKTTYQNRPEAVLCVDSGGVVAFHNSAFSQLFGLGQHTIYGQNLKNALPDFFKAVSHLPIDVNDMHMTGSIDGFQINNQLCVNITVNAIHWLDDYSVFLIDESKTGFATENEVKPDGQISESNSVISHILNKPELKQALILRLKKELLDHGLDQNSDESFRSHLVELMQECLNVWNAHTQTNRIELAEACGYWKVSIDDGRLRTRAMDRYLNVKHLPNKPRWRQVVKTAHFILSEYNLDKQHRHHLNIVLSTFLDIMKKY